MLIPYLLQHQKKKHFIVEYLLPESIKLLLTILLYQLQVLMYMFSRHLQEERGGLCGTM